MGNILELIDNFVQKYTDPEEVNCGSQVGKGKYHKHASHPFCHEVSREHGKLGRPKGGATATADKEPPKKKPAQATPASNGFKPPVNGRVAQSFALDDLGEPSKIKPSDISHIVIEAPEESQKEFVKRALRLVPQQHLAGLKKVEVKPTKDDKMGEVKGETIVLNKAPDDKDTEKTGVTEEKGETDVLHMMGHRVWAKLPPRVQKIDISLYNSHKSNPRAFVSGLAQSSPEEFFAEIFMHYLKHPGFLWIRDRAAYNYLYRNVMEGMEFRSWSRTINPEGPGGLPGTGLT